MRTHFLTRMFLGGILFLCGACARGGSPSLTISPEDIPIPAQATTIVRSSRTDIAMAEISVWTFTTPDTPAHVWQGYREYMRQRWGFYESQPNRADKTLLVQSCPFYWLTMTSTPMANANHVTITFGKESCR